MEGPQATQSESETSTLIHSRAVPARLPALVSFQPESLVNFRPVSTARETPAVAAAWAENLADAAERGLVIKLLLDEWSSNNTPEAIALARRLIESDQNVDAYVIDSVVAKWHEQNPQEALNWVGGLPDGALKTRSWTLLAANADSAGILEMAEYAARNSNGIGSTELVSAIGQRLSFLRCEAWSDANASEPSRPRKPECRADSRLENLQGIRHGVSHTWSPRFAKRSVSISLRWRMQPYIRT